MICHRVPKPDGPRGGLLLFRSTRTTFSCLVDAARFRFFFPFSVFRIRTRLALTGRKPKTKPLSARVIDEVRHYVITVPAQCDEHVWRRISCALKFDSCRHGHSSKNLKKKRNCFVFYFQTIRLATSSIVLLTYAI